MSILCRVIDTQDFILHSDFMFRKIVKSHTNLLNFITWNPSYVSFPEMELSSDSTILLQFYTSAKLKYHLEYYTEYCTKKKTLRLWLSKLVKNDRLRSAKLLSLLKKNHTNQNECSWYPIDISGNASSRCHLSSRILMFRRDKGNLQRNITKSDNFAINWHVQCFPN